MSKKDEKLDSPQVIAWANQGDFGEEMMIVGNREGLLAIRSAIDAALDKKEGRIEEPEVEFMKVLLVDQARRVEKPSLADKLLPAGCLLLAVAAFLIFLVGLAELARHFF
jgi:hypothetical protein